MENWNPSVSVVMAIYNGERYLQESLESILRQTYTDFELVAINDGSTDQSLPLLQSFKDHRLRVISNERNLGLTVSLNRGLRLARGTLIARQDADDIAMPERLEKQVKHMHRHPSVGIVGTQAETIGPDGKPIGILSQHKACTHDGICFALVFGNPFVHSSVVFRKNLIAEQLGGYDERYRYNQDFALWSKALRITQGANLDEELVKYRSHPHSVTRPTDATRAAFRSNIDLNIAVQKENIKWALGSTELEEWARLWSNLNVPYILKEPQQAGRIHEFIGQIYRRYLAARPYADKNREIKLLVAQAYRQLARLCCGENPLWTFRALITGARHDPAGTMQELVRACRRVTRVRR